MQEKGVESGSFARAISKTIIEPIMPTMEVVPNLPVAQLTSKSVKNTAKSQILEVQTKRNLVVLMLS